MTGPSTFRAVFGWRIGFQFADNDCIMDTNALDADLLSKKQLLDGRVSDHVPLSAHVASLELKTH